MSLAGAFQPPPRIVKPCVGVGLYVARAWPWQIRRPANDRLTRFRAVRAKLDPAGDAANAMDTFYVDAPTRSVARLEADLAISQGSHLLVGGHDRALPGHRPLLPLLHLRPSRLELREARGPRFCGALQRERGWWTGDVGDLFVRAVRHKHESCAPTGRSGRMGCEVPSRVEKLQRGRWRAQVLHCGARSTVTAPLVRSTVATLPLPSPSRTVDSSPAASWRRGRGRRAIAELVQRRHPHSRGSLRRAVPARVSRHGWVGRARSRCSRNRP
jgi:hypothetical protein